MLCSVSMPPIHDRERASTSVGLFAGILLTVSGGLLFFAAGSATSRQAVLLLHILLGVATVPTIILGTVVH